MKRLFCLDLFCGAESAGYWKTVGADTPRDRQLLMRFEPGGDIWAVRWSDDEGGWTDGDHTVFRPNYNHAQWCEVLQNNQGISEQ